MTKRLENNLNARYYDSPYLPIVQIEYPPQHDADESNIYKQCKAKILNGLFGVLP